MVDRGLGVARLIAMNSVAKWFGGNLGALTREQAVAAANLADKLEPLYLKEDFHVAMLESLDILGLEY